MTRIIFALLYVFGFVCLAAALLVITIGPSFVDLLGGVLGC